MSKRSKGGSHYPEFKRKHRMRFPTKLTLFTMLCVGIVAALYYFNQEIADRFLPSYESAFTVLAAVLLGTICLVSWTIWFLRWRSIGIGIKIKLLAVLAIPLITFLVLYEPVPGGGLFPDRWRPRFWQRGLDELNVTGTADLSKVSANDFPQFLGPQRDGRIRQTTLHKNWQAKSPELLWRRDIGYAWSGFSAVNGFAVTMEQRGSEECVTCYTIATGEPAWVHKYEARHEDPLGGIGPLATPTIADGRVYTVGAKGHVHCLDGSTGKVIWSVNLLDLLEIPHEFKQTMRGVTVIVDKSGVNWGRSGSPLVHKNKVILPCGGPSGARSSLIAFDSLTGEEIWRGGREQISYSSPIVANILGTEQILIVNESSVAGHDPETGEELWKFQRRGSSSGDANTSQPTVVSSSEILLSKGYGLGGELIKISQTDSGFKVNSVWKSPRVLKTKLTNPVILDGYSYAISNEVLECVQLSDGEQMWKKGRFGHGQVLLVGDVLLVHSEKGELHLVQAKPDGFKELSRHKTINGVCWNTMCLFGDALLVRSDIEAACFKIPVDPPKTDGAGKNDAEKSVSVNR